jgi:anti-sigma B factor antagonist
MSRGSVLDSTKPFEARIERSEVDVVVHLAGELDISGAPDMKRAFDDILGFDGRVIVDLRSVSFMDSMGLGALIDGRNRLEDDGAVVMLVANSGPAGRLLALTKLDESFPVFDSIEAARESG